jgi:hypothetical protein
MLNHNIWFLSPMTRKENLILTYQILYVSQQDLSHAAFFADHMLEKSSHAESWEVNWKEYLHQVAYMTAMVTAYGRPFTECRGKPQFPARVLKNLIPEEKLLHNSLLDLRNKVYAHTELAERKVRPIIFNNKPSAIEVLPSMRMSASELIAVRHLIKKISISIDARLKELAPDIQGEI